MGIIDISEIDKAEVLKCLINDACVSLGWLFPNGNKQLNYDECKELLIENETKYFDFYKGKSLFINLNGHKLYTAEYDKANGEDACYKSIKHLLTQKSKQNAQTEN